MGVGVRGVGEGCGCGGERCRRGVWVWCGGERCRRGVLGVGGEEVWGVRGVGEGCWVWGWG